MGKAIYWNGTTFQNIDDNSTITLSGDITGSGIAAITTALKTSGVTAGSYGSDSAIPVLTIDSNGRITAASTSAVSIPTGLTSGTTSTGFVNYSGTTSTAGQLNGGTTAPAATNRLNYNGYLYATRFYGDGSQLTGITMPTGLTSGSASSGFVNYNSTTATAGQWDGGATAPTATTRLNYGGYLYATRVYGAVYNDYAEYFLKDEELEPGDIISKNLNGDGYIKSKVYKDKRVVGVYSDDYAHCIGGLGDENDEKNFASVGLAGRVKVKVKGKINIGDLIVASDIPGVGTAAGIYTPGTVVGKALENYNSNEIGKIKILIMSI